MSAKQKSGGCKKADRNRDWCKAYRSAGTREINKAVRLAKHCAARPDDTAARETLKALLGPSDLRTARQKIVGTSPKMIAAYVLLGGDANNRIAA